MQKYTDSISGLEDALNKETATHSSILAWETHGQRSLVGYSLWGPKRVGTELKLLVIQYPHLSRNVGIFVLQSRIYLPASKCRGQ